MCVCMRSSERDMGHCAAPGPGESSPSFHCVCERVLVFWDMLHSAERKCVGMCVFNMCGYEAVRSSTLHRINKGSLYQ